MQWEFPVCVFELKSAQTSPHLLFLKVQILCPTQEVMSSKIDCPTFDYYKIMSDKNRNLLAGRKHSKGITPLI